MQAGGVVRALKNKKAMMAAVTGSDCALCWARLRYCSRPGAGCRPGMGGCVGRGSVGGCNEAEGDLNPSPPRPGDFLTEFFKLCCRKETTEEVLGRGAAEDEGKGQSHHLANQHEAHHGSMLKLSKQSLPILVSLPLF